MASTKDMMLFLIFFLALLPVMPACCVKASGLGGGGQYLTVVRFLTSPRLRGEVDAHSASGEGGGAAHTDFRICGASPSPQPSPREERGEGEDSHCRNPSSFAARWIASRSLSSGAHS